MIEPCPECGGLGYVEVDAVVQVAFEYDIGTKQEVCNYCKGVGEIEI